MKFTSSFPNKPPHQLPAMPREFLCSFVVGMAVFAVVILAVAPWLTKILVLAVLAGAVYGAYKYFMKHMEAEWAPYNDSFFVPLRESFKDNHVSITRGQLTYLWNYGSVPVSWTKIAKVDSRWNGQVTVSIENTDYKKLWSKEPTE